ncbi:guanylate cyclase 2D-like [Aplysia californica]|uniref:Guanylate cyclase 2D-like n=1 Tax=Aplysia californica TaxID=6500 RepID=A0ABM1VXV3_APLCA|nr:guanylate cyclase 2D-like [Aplysia californica]
MKFQTCLTPPNRRLSSTLSTLTQSLLPALSLLTFLAVPVLFPRHASSQRTFQMGVLVPLSGQKSMGVEVVAAAYLALDKVNDDDQLIHLRRLGYNFSVTVRDTGCDTGKGLQQVVDMVTDLSHTGKKVDAFIGPSCDNVCEAAGLLAGRWGIPMISFGCEESKLSDRKIYPTFLRTTSQFASMARFMENILLHYKWSRVMMVTTSSQVWLETEAELLHEFNSGSFKAFQWDINEEEWPGITDILREKTKISHGTFHWHAVLLF